MGLFRLFVSKFRYFALPVAFFRHFEWLFFRHFVILRGVFSLFRLFVLRFFVISLFRVALFRYFVFLRGVISLFCVALFRGKKTKRKWHKSATIHESHFIFSVLNF